MWDRRNTHYFSSKDCFHPPSPLTNKKFVKLMRWNITEPPTLTLKTMLNEVSWKCVKNMRFLTENSWFTVIKSTTKCSDLKVKHYTYTQKHTKRWQSYQTKKSSPHLAKNATIWSPKWDRNYWMLWGCLILVDV